MRPPSSSTVTKGTLIVRNLVYTIGRQGPGRVLSNGPIRSIVSSEVISSAVETEKAGPSTEPVGEDETNKEKFHFVYNSKENLSDHVRSTMKKVPHPLTVITARVPDGKVTGLLVSSFNTVTLQPQPLVSFNVKLPSSTYDQIVKTGKFDATFVWSVQTAKLFSTQGVATATNCKEDRNGVMAGGISKLECEWLKVKSVRVEDHVIMVGRVIACTEGVETFKKPLLYHHGKHGIAVSIEET